MRRKRYDETYKGKLEEDDKPLDRLVGKGAPRRQVRLVTEPTNGNIGLLMAIKPQGPRLTDEGLELVGHEELLRTLIEIAPGMKIRPKVRVSVTIELAPEQMAEYERYVASMKMPQAPLTP